MDDGGQTVQQNQEPWSGVQGHLKHGYQQARNLYDQGPQQFYGGQTYVNADPLEHMANESRLSYAQNQLPGQISQVQGAQSSMLSAPDLDSNPYVQKLAERANQRIGQDFQNYVMPGIQSNAINAQNLGGSRQGIAQGLAAGKAADAMADTTAKLYSDAYNSGLNQQARAMQLAPQTMNLGFMPADTYAQSGQFLRGEKELALQDDMARFNFEQERDQDSLSRYLGNLQGGLNFSNSTATTSGVGNRFGNVMGGAMVGNSLFPDSNWGAVGGGLLGLL